MVRELTDGVTSYNQRYGIISSFKFHPTDNLEIKFFPDADKLWLHCVVGHRRNKLFQRFISDMESFDIIGGKIANDDTNATILAYMAGTFGEIGSPRADEICISLLLTDRLEDQYCFRSERSLKCLVWIKSEKVWKR